MLPLQLGVGVGPGETVLLSGPDSHHSSRGTTRCDCAAAFQNETTPQTTECPANTLYQGASNASECRFRDDIACQSPGPDMVAGAVHSLRERLDLLDFTTSYLEVRQITVKRGQELKDIDIMTTFQCFTPDLWFVAIFMEIGQYQKMSSAIDLAFQCNG